MSISKEIENIFKKTKLNKLKTKRVLKIENQTKREDDNNNNNKSNEFSMVVLKKLKSK